jgi:hypothetical protein
MKPLSGNRISGARKALNSGIDVADQVTSRYEKFHRGDFYKIGICSLLNRCTVVLARPPVNLFSAYALASSQIEFRFRINN